MNLADFIAIDLPPLVTAMLAAITCGLLGNFLVLRRMSLMGDAISHAVLPGLVAAFLISGSRQTGPMFIGAAAAGIITALLVELTRKLGRVESGAAMGVVFTILFAAGVLLLEQAGARGVDLDAGCVFNGQLEIVGWEGAWPTTLAELFSVETLGSLPHQLITLSIATALSILFVVVLFKELRLSSFDPGLATALGFSATGLHYLLMVFVASAVVASFEAVGSILVIAMLICPAATARMLTDRLKTQLVLSVLISLATTISGYFLAAFGPFWIGLEHSVNAAGMMTVMAGGVLTLSIILSPSHGLVAKRVRRLRLTAQIAAEDVLAMLWRLEEISAHAQIKPLSYRQAAAALGGGVAARLGLRGALRAKQIKSGPEGLSLTDLGRDAGRVVMRSHRLWESYLVRELGLRADHVHRTAMDLEHVTDASMREALAGSAQPDRDPHGKPIPHNHDASEN